MSSSISLCIRAIHTFTLKKPYETLRFGVERSYQVQEYRIRARFVQSYKVSLSPWSDVLRIEDDEKENRNESEEKKDSVTSLMVNTLRPTSAVMTWSKQGNVPTRYHVQCSIVKMSGEMSLFSDLSTWQNFYVRGVRVFERENVIYVIHITHSYVLS